MLAQEIARVERGEEPEYPKQRGPEPIRTYCYSGSFLIGDARIEGMEGLHEFGRRATQAVIETAHLVPDERALACEARSRELLAGRAAA
jgi:hypothetical protein